MCIRDRYVGRVLLYLRCPGRGYRVAVIVHGHNAILRMGAISFGGYDKGQYYTFNDAFCQELRGSTVGFVASEDDGNKSQSRSRKNNWNN